MRFNVINYLIGEGIRNLFKNKKSTISSLMIMCATMLIFGLFFVIGENINAFVENVAFAMYIVKATPKHIRRQVPMVLSLVGLSGKAKMYPNELSGGEQQRVALARALVNNPSMIIADEPTGNLDPDTAWDIMDLLNEINLRGTTVVVATHAKEIVDQMKKRVIHINKGVIVKDDKKGGYDCEI